MVTVCGTSYTPTDSRTMKARFSWASLEKGGAQLAFLEKYSVRKDDLNDKMTLAGVWEAISWSSCVGELPWRDSF